MEREGHRRRETTQASRGWQDEVGDETGEDSKGLREPLQYVATTARREPFAPL